MARAIRNAIGEKLKYLPFWGSPLFYKAPPRQFQPPKCKLTPPKIQTVEGRFLCISIQQLQIGGRQSLFGGCQFTFWRVPIYILEAEIVLGVLYRKGVSPKKGGTLDSRERFARIDSRESFAIETPIFIARQADSHESLEFPIRANHPIRANRAN